MPPPQAPLPPGVKFLPSGVKFLPGPSVSPPKPSSAPPGPQTVDSSPMGSLPLTLAPKGKLALPPNPITHSLLTGPKPSLQDRRNQQSKGLVADIAARRAQLEAHPVHGSIAGTIREFTGANIHGFAHPLAALESKGEFAAPKRMFDGHEVSFSAQPLPFFGGGSVLKDAGEAIVKRSPEEAAQHVFDSAQQAKAEGFGHVPLVVKPAVEPYVASAHEPVDGFLDNSSRPGGIRQSGYAYHRTSVQAFSTIAKEGLKASNNSGDLHGVYFGNNPLAVSHFANKAADSVYLRVREAAVPDLGLHPNKAYGEMLTPHDVPAQNLEYLGHDGSWHPVSEYAAHEATGGDLGRQIRESLLDAPAVRKAQKAGFSAERAQRVKAGTEAGIKAGGGTAGHLAAKAHLANALPREFFGGLKHFTPEQVDQAHRVIDEAPIQFFQKIQARDAISNAAERGIAPTEGEQGILERVFGKVAGTGEDQAKLASFWDKFVSYTNIPRALRSSADVSAAMRQGLVVLVTHPKVWGRQFAKSIKSFGSEEFYQAQQEAIHSDPLYPLFLKWKVPFTEIGGNVPNTEEAFIGGQAAEHLHELPGIKGTPVATLLRPASNVIRRSDRAFTGFQNGARFEMAKMLAESASFLGHDLNDQHLGESIAKVVGTFTGRGVTPKILSGHLTTMNALMFSPRLMAARLNLMSPVYYAKLDPFARAEALRGARNLVASIGTVMFVAKMLGAEVNFDPRSSNFTKIKIGNTRIDIAGGFSQYVRFIAQEMTREAISSSGHKSHIGWGQKDISDLANLTKLGRSKSAPIPGLLWDEGSGKDFIGQPIKQKHELFSNAPFVVQDTRDAFKQSGSKAAVIDGFLSAIGLGVQSYKDKPPKATNSGGSGGYGDTGGSYGGGTGGYGDTSGGYGGG